MKGRQKSLTAFLKATNLSSCLLADLLILLLMILYSSSLCFFYSLSYSLLFYSLSSYHLKKEDTSLLISLWIYPFSYKCSMRSKVSAWSCSNRAWPLGCSIPDFSVWLCPSPASRQLCVQDQFAFSKTCSQRPQEIISLHPFLDFATADALSTFPQLLSFTAQWGPFWIPTCTALKLIHYIVCRGYLSFLCYFQFKESRIKWFLQWEGEQIKEWMNRSMNKTFVEEQKYACYLASWSAIIFIPCRGYSVSLFLGLDPNLTDVALALQAEPQSTNLLHLSLLH